MNTDEHHALSAPVLVRRSGRIWKCGPSTECGPARSSSRACSRFRLVPAARRSPGAAAPRRPTGAPARPVPIGPSPRWRSACRARCPGANQALGLNIDWGAKLAVQQENAKGDLPFNLAIKEADDQGDQSKGATAAQLLIQDPKVVGVVGPAFSGPTAAAGALYSSANLVAVSVATRPSLTSSGFKTFYRVVANDNVQGPAAADYMAKVLKAHQRVRGRRQVAVRPGPVAGDRRRAEEGRRHGRDRQRGGRHPGLLAAGLQGRCLRRASHVLRRLLRRRRGVRQGAEGCELHRHDARRRRIEGPELHRHRRAGRRRRAGSSPAPASTPAPTRSTRPSPRTTRSWPTPLRARTRSRATTRRTPSSAC